MAAWQAARNICPSKLATYCNVNYIINIKTHDAIRKCNVQKNNAGHTDRNK